MYMKRATPGQIMPMVALLMVALMGMAALGIDGSNVYSQHRRLQADLDVAVKVAAADMFDFNPASPAYTDTAKTSIVAAAQLLANDGYPNTLTITSSPSIIPSGGGFCGNDPAAGITLCNPPQNGPFAGAPHYAFVEGRLSRDVGGFFGGVIGLGKLHTNVTAVAWHGGYHQPYALIGLDPTASDCSIDGSGGSMTINGSLVGDALTCGGTNPTVTGHSDEHGGDNSGQIVGQRGTNQGVALITDPYSATGAITPTEPVTNVPDVQPIIPTQCYTEVEHFIPTITTAQLLDPIHQLPGTHFYFPPADGSVGIVPLTGPVGGNAGTNDFLPLCDGTPTGQPGVYYFTSGILTPGKVYINTFNSVFIFDSANGELFHDTGQANWTLSAPTSGPYQGIALTQSRTGIEPPCPSINQVNFTGGEGGKGQFTASGVVDLPCTDIFAQGSSTVTVNGIVVTWNIQTSGNTTVLVNYNPSYTPADKGSVLVQ